MSSEIKHELYQKRQKRHTIASGIWLLVFSVLFAGLLYFAIEENVLAQDDAFITGLVYLIIALMVILWITTAIWLVQRKIRDVASFSHPVYKFISAGIIITAMILFVNFIVLLGRAYSSYLIGEYWWVIYIVIAIVGLFLFGGVWHLLRLRNPDFVRRKKRPFTRKGPRVFYVGLCLAIIIGSGTTLGLILQKANDRPEPQQFIFESGTQNSSVILLIGDGMGFPHIELGSLVEYGPGANSSVDRFPYSTAISTSNIDGGTTDSAAAATAIATGVRTQNGRISTSWDNQNLTTILEIAQGKGYATGLISICQMTHATPAAFAAHQPSRDMYIDIGADIAEKEIDVLLGGGSDANYLGNYISDMQTDGYEYATNKTELSNAGPVPVLGLFANGNLPRAQEYTVNTTAPTLLEMVQKGVQLLNDTSKPYFLMVEASAIDWAGHANDKVYAAHEMIEFDKVINYTIDLALNQSDLQVLLTADHETGGLHIQGHDFTTPLPLETDSLEVKIQKRTERANQVSVTWSTGGHTNSEVILAGIGPYASQLETAEANIDIFSLMRMAIEGESGPIVDGINDGYYPLAQIYIVLIGVIAANVVVAVLYIKKSKR